MVTEKQKGILRDIGSNKISLDEISEWMREELATLVFHDPQLIDVNDSSVYLTEAGRMAIAAAQ